MRKAFIIGILAGTAVGAICALIFAPERSRLLTEQETSITARQGRRKRDKARRKRESIKQAI